MTSRFRSATRLALMLALAVPASLVAQNPADPTMRPRPAPAPARPAPPPVRANPGEVVAPPIECWWKTDRSAVRVGETFDLTLTCAVLDTDRVKVVVDESALAPSALHLVPFDIVGGERFRDIVNTPRRFFQYRYSMRVLGEEFFGKEVSLPRLQVSYRVQNSLQGGSALQGRETQYSLVPVPMSEGPFAVVAEPTPAYIAIPSMLVVTILVLILAAYRIRHMEIRYGSD